MDRTTLLVLLLFSLTTSSSGIDTHDKSNVATLNFQIVPQDVVINRNSRLIWNCSASSGGNVDIEWGKLGSSQVFDNNSQGRIHITTNGTLSFAKVKSKDEGYYYCIAKDEKGAIRSKPVKLQVAAMAKEFDQSPPKYVTLYRGGQLYLSCSIRATPAAKIWWLRNKKNLSEIDDNRIYVDTEKGYLLFDKVKVQDSGRYRCVAIHNGRRKLSRDTIVTVNELNKTAVPKLIFSPRNLTVNVNSRVILIVAADMPVFVHWGFQAGTGFQDSPINMAPMPYRGGTQHHIRSVQTRHDRVWICNIVAKHNHKSVQCPPTYLKVVAPPRVHCYRNVLHFKKQLQVKVNFTTISSVSSGLFTHSCDVFGHPKPQLLWLHNGKPISYNQPSSRFRITKQVGGESFSFNLRKIELSDAGYYQVAAVNEGGFSYSSSYLLTVRKHAGPTPPRNLRVIKISTYNISLAWGAPGSPGSNVNHKLRYYVVSYWLVGATKHVYSKEVFASEQSTVISRDLKPYRRYVFVVHAWDFATRSDPSNELVIRTAEDVPEASPRFIKLDLESEQQFQDIVVKWETVDPLYQNGKITQYIVSYEDSIARTAKIYNISGYAREYKIRNVIPNQIYAVKVAAATSVGLGPFSSPKLITTSKRPGIKDFSYPKLEILFINASSISFTWKIISINGHKLIGYQLDYRAHSVSKSHESLVFASNATRYSLFGLESSTEYYISIRGIYKTANKSSQGPSTDRIISTTVKNITVSPPNITVAASIVNIESKSFNLSWQRPSFANPIELSRFMIRYRSLNKTESDLTVLYFDKKVISAKVQNLKPYTSYVIEMAYFVYSEYGGEMKSGFTESLTVRTKQDIPESPPILNNITEISPGFLYINWNAPKITNGIISSYRIKYKARSELIWMTREVDKRQIVLKDLTSKSYLVDIAAATNAGVGPSTTTTITLNQTIVSTINTYEPTPVVNAKERNQASVTAVAIVIVSIGGSLAVFAIVCIISYVLRRYKSSGSKSDINTNKGDSTKNFQEVVIKHLTSDNRTMEKILPLANKTEMNGSNSQLHNLSDINNQSNYRISERNVSKLDVYSKPVTLDHELNGWNMTIRQNIYVA